jgi:hypothetical protein
VSQRCELGEQFIVVEDAAFDCGRMDLVQRQVRSE